MNKANIKIHALPSDENSPAVEKEFGQLALDIFHTENEIIIIAPIAGVKEDDITLSITDDTLTIQGVRAQHHEIKKQDYYTKECFWGRFARSIVLPLEADTSKISAHFENNVLEIHIGKKPIEKDQTKIIKINR
jgi:HSP20 family protein